MTDTQVVVPDIDGLLAALRARRAALPWPDSFINDVGGAGMAEMLAAGTGRRPSCAALGVMIDLLGVSITITPDPAKAARLAEWYASRRPGEVIANRRDLNRKAALARWARTSPEERARVAGHAGRARWAKERRNAETIVDVG
jgi:hypothetical protein